MRFDIGAAPECARRLEFVCAAPGFPGLAMHWERLDESIKVRADFTGGSILPVVFRRGEQQIRVKTINTRWQDSRGQNRRCYFAVTADSGDVYQLCFDTGDLTWKLEYVMYE